MKTCDDCGEKHEAELQLPHRLQCLYQKMGFSSLCLNCLDTLLRIDGVRPVWVALDAGADETVKEPQ